MNIAAWLLVWLLPSGAFGQCPSICSCTTRKRTDSAVEATFSMTCSSKGLKLTELPAPAGLRSLNVSGNGLSGIMQDDLINIPTTLTSLNLSHNDIQFVQDGAFTKLSSLQTLDLSYNNLEWVNASMFDGLKNLIQLSLSYNKLRTVPDKLVTVLTNLLRLDFNSPYLVCDCNLSWTVRVKKKRPDFSLLNTRCSLPKALRGIDVQALKRTQLQCDLSVELLEFEVLPSSGQVVFAGDSMPFVCHVTADHNQTQVLWLREGLPVETNKSQGIVVQAVHTSMDTVVRHSVTLTIDHLSTRHTGAWKCQVGTPVGTAEKSVQIIVVSESTAFCPPLHLRTNKGLFSWPKTMAGVRQELPCDKKEGGKAYYQCNAEGLWQELNLSQCKYTGIITRSLEDIAVHATNETTDILKVGSSLQTLLAKPESIQDKMDVVFIARFLSTATSRAPGQRRELPQQVAVLIVNITSMMMNVHRNLLLAAEREEQACSSIVQALERVLLDSLAVQRTLSLRLENIAAEGQRLDANVAFMGIVCNSSIGGAVGLPRWQGYALSTFQCTAGTGAGSAGGSNLLEKTEAFLRIPDTVFAERSHPNERKVVVIFYRNDNLFQRSGPHGGTAVQSAVMSAVVVAGDSSVNVSAPLTVGWQSGSRAAARQWPVRWDAGQWSGSDCAVNQSIGNMSIAYCRAAGSFALLQDLSFVLEPGSSSRPDNAIFRALQVPFYVGTVASIVAMFVVITTYCIHFSYIRLSKKLKHCLINTCVCILLLDVVFAAGIRTQLDSLCKAVGICIHYFSICVIFWITVTSWNTYKKLRRRKRPVVSLTTSFGDGGDGSQEGVIIPQPPKPMLKFYLFAWGIPTIICGITAAVNVNFYNTGRYCFLAWDPSLLAFYGVVGFFVLVNCLLFTCMSFALARRRSGGELTGASAAAVQLDEAYPLDDCRRSDVDGPVTELRSAHMRTAAASSAAVAGTASIASSEADEEYRPGAQIAGIVLLLLLYMLVWASGALAIAAPFEHVVPNMEEIFGYMYMGFSIILGLFLVIFYCFARNDTRLCRPVAARKHPDGDAAATTVPATSMSATPDVVEGTTGGAATPLAADVGQQAGLAAAAVQQGRRGESADCSAPTAVAGKSVHAIDYVSNLLRATDEHNRQVCAALASNSGPAAPPSSRGSGSPAMHSGGAFPASAAAATIFYNARQNGVARKYWAKASKLKKMKQLTQSTTAKCLSDGESTKLLGSAQRREGTPGSTSHESGIRQCTLGDLLPPPPPVPPPPKPYVQQQQVVWQRQRLASAASEPRGASNLCANTGGQQFSPSTTPWPQLHTATPDILAGSLAGSMLPQQQHPVSAAAAGASPSSTRRPSAALLQHTRLPAAYGAVVRQSSHRVHHSDNELDVGVLRSAHGQTVHDSSSAVGSRTRTLDRKAVAGLASSEARREMAFPLRPGYLAACASGSAARATDGKTVGGGASEAIPDVCKDLGRATVEHEAASGSSDRERYFDGRNPAVVAATSSVAAAGISVPALDRSSPAASRPAAERCESPWSMQQPAAQLQQHRGATCDPYAKLSDTGCSVSDAAVGCRRGSDSPAAGTALAAAVGGSPTYLVGDAASACPSSDRVSLPCFTSGSAGLVTTARDGRRLTDDADDSVSPYACISVVPACRDPPAPVPAKSAEALAQSQIYENSAAILSSLPEGRAPTYQNISRLLAAEPLYENFAAVRNDKTVEVPPPIYENLSELETAFFSAPSN